MIRVECVVVVAVAVGGSWSKGDQPLSRSPVYLPASRSGPLQGTVAFRYTTGRAQVCDCDRQLRGPPPPTHTTGLTSRTLARLHEHAMRQNLGSDRIPITVTARPLSTVQVTVPSTEHVQAAVQRCKPGVRLVR